MRFKETQNWFTGVLTRSFVAIIVTGLAACGGDGGGEEESANGSPVVNPPSGPPVLRGSAPVADGWSDATVLASGLVHSTGTSYLATATMDDLRVAIISSNVFEIGAPNYRSALRIFRSTASASPWNEVSFELDAHTGHYLSNGRLATIVHSTAPESYLEATYDNGWSTRTIAVSEISNFSILTSAKVTTGQPGQRALDWNDDARNGGVFRRFSLARPGSDTWDTRTTPPLVWNASSFLSSGAFVVVSPSVLSEPSGDRVASLYDQGLWSDPAPVISRSPAKYVLCPVITALGGERYAMTWVEQFVDPATSALSFAVRFAVFGGLARLSDPEDVFLTGSDPRFGSSYAVSCPRVHLDSTGKLTFLWKLFGDVLVRRYASGAFIDHPVVVPMNTNLSTERFDQDGNMLLVGSNTEGIFARTYRASTNTWSELVQLWSGQSSLQVTGVAMNANGDAVIAWYGFSYPAPFRETHLTLFARTRASFGTISFPR